ncbi:2-oxoglutarate-dependent dioxygenase mpl2-like [Lingula anatina]|uniref:2-oxoglutarate-dependent dioxygenase mpl2-like n=1 Tax=Lingula anatina TaxID=7574 RepID=A0A1S3JGL0_LINAN|nr:2-oxoglutarate-dependent dioxygenase mpl2-like [Lingula anatina]|eukprot:XP_013409545.1 2-oxoglutarate-dependent dioxygenase mpl2-like [Lingula anatina]
MDFTKNQTAIRTLHYPPAGQNRVFQSGQLRCGEHADYGSLTLLFQDSPGLEIMTEAGKWIPVSPVAGTVVINIGDMLQRWSSDRLPSTRHRVTFGGKEEKSVPRQSLALFMNPDTDTVIRCLDGSDKYQPVTMKEYLAMKHKAAYCSD